MFSDQLIFNTACIALMVFIASIQIYKRHARALAVMLNDADLVAHGQTQRKIQQSGLFRKVGMMNIHVDEAAIAKKIRFVTEVKRICFISFIIMVPAFIIHFF